MKAYRPRGVVLNYEFFRRNLSDDIPYIYLTIQSANWVAEPEGGYSFTTSNPLYGLGEIIHALYEESTGMEYRAPIISTQESLQITVYQQPAVTLTFIAFPKNKVQSSTITVLSTDFTSTSDYWSATIDISSYTQPFMVVLESDQTPVYFDTRLTNTHLTLNASQVPSFDTLVTVHHL